jgi:sulfite reductase (NADPH) flavoprotein alpha-component
VSGKAEELASAAHERLAQAGIESELHNLAHYGASNLTNIDHALFITSSWGQGAPPPDSIEFIHAIETPRIRLNGLEYAVFSLGTQKTENFIGTGWRIDSALAARGAKRLLPRYECDRSDRVHFDAWLDSVLLILSAEEVSQNQNFKLA